MRAVRKPLRRPLTAALAVALLGVAGTAHADNAVADGDGVTPVTNTDLSLGTVDCAQTTTGSALVAVSRQGSTSSANVFANGAVVTVSVLSVSGGVSAVLGGTTISLPATWSTSSNGTLSNAVASTVSVTPTIQGPGSGSVVFRATGRNTAGVTISRDDAMAVTWTAGSCVTNTAPSTPGVPTASASPTQGGFTLSWAAATDAEGDPLTYTLQGRDADDAAWAEVAAGLAGTSHSFAAGAPTEGTWTYRVMAVEGGTTPLASGWSAASDPVVVDRTGPHAPTASADRDPEYAADGTSWWRDGVTVSFSGAGDPALPDTSAGSGVASVSSAQAFATTGPFAASGQATDAAGNLSAAGGLAGAVDAADPQVSLSCPGPIVLGTTAQATWTASDVGSGLATAAAGQVALDTSAVGTRGVTVAAGTAVDRVGNESAGAGCSYQVVYAFAGFFQPVDMTRVNVTKAGSGVPVKFSLDGDHGLAVLAGAPTFTITGGALGGDTIEQTVTAGGSSLSYDPVADQYVYVWKTDKAWAGKSGTFRLVLDDGTAHTATFSFTK